MDNVIDLKAYKNRKEQEEKQKQLKNKENQKFVEDKEQHNNRILKKYKIKSKLKKDKLDNLIDKLTEGDE